MTQHNFVFYRGPSMLDGQPIVAIATVDSGNSKTGAMVQTWIVRGDISPVVASRTGQDSSICGVGEHACKHMGKHDANGMRIARTRSCYVQLYVPQNIWETYCRGSYDDLSGDIASASARVSGLLVRLGAYGDPAAVPIGVWHALLESSRGHTGYTHQWRLFPELAEYCMASADSSEERVAARVLGFRTFRVAPSAGWTREANEVLCGASAEAGRKTHCAACRACGGTSSRARADIMIPAHGTGRRIVQ